MRAGTKSEVTHAVPVDVERVRGGETAGISVGAVQTRTDLRALRDGDPRDLHFAGGAPRDHTDRWQPTDDLLEYRLE